MIKGQDIVILASLMGANDDASTYLEIGKRAKLSASEAHAAVRRLQESMLLNDDRKPVKRNVMEFLVHGLRYMFPFRESGLAMGMPTAYAAPIAAEEFAVSGLAPVWSTADGKVYGKAYVPIYPTAPLAAAEDSELYDRLVLIDMLRGGRLRERKFAERKLQEVMS